jgi:hypothetical protein
MNVKRYKMVLLVTICCISVVLLRAEGSFWEDPQAYLGQPRPSNIPKIFAPGLLADKDTFVMGRVAFSRDGKEFYYTQNDSWESLAHSKIKIIRYADQHWSKPSLVNQNFISPTLSIDGTILYFRKGNMRNVWQSQRIGNDWSEPKPFLETTYPVYDYMPTTSGNAYVGGDPSPEDVKDGIKTAFSILTNVNGKDQCDEFGAPHQRARL